MAIGENMTPRWGSIPAREITKAVQGKLAFGAPQTVFERFNSDSRDVRKGDLFWALKGERFDGHDFVIEAISKGASGAVVQNGFNDFLPDQSDAAVISVDDPLKALGDFASWWRRQHRAKIVAITGSSGKTTTKEMTAAILKMGNQTIRNTGNQNNLIGVPITLLKLADSHEMAVIEMGMNHPGEIARLTKIAGPDAAAILNVGMAHLEGLGDIQGVAAAKTELIAESGPNTKIILNGDDAVLMAHARQFKGRFITFGLAEENAVQGVHIKTEGIDGMRFDLAYNKEILPIRIPVSGIHNVKNALAAAAICLALGEPKIHISKGLNNFKGIKGRFQCLQLENDILLIDDTYNANPTALKSALHAAAQLVNRGGRLLVGLGDMLEMGDTAVSAHLDAGRHIAELGVSRLFLMGTHAEDVRKGAVSEGMPKTHVTVSETHSELTANIIGQLKANDVILLKGSRNMQFEKISESLKRHFGERSS
jgi:UDP-N-acetylmuramoyl-tripeptide--D-alanyl-D-alanine ligase